MFAARLARSVGRLDWWNIKAEHTPMEWRAQIAMANVDPFGDERDDIRTASMTANLMSTMMSLQKIEISDDDFRKITTSLADYLGRTKADDFVDLKALERMREANERHR